MKHQYGNGVWRESDSKEVMNIFWVGVLKFFLVILFISILASCTKEDEPTCKTCDVNVKYWTATSGNQYYIESTAKYCDQGWQAVDGHTEIRSGTNSGVAWKKTSTTKCHE